MAAPGIAGKGLQIGALAGSHRVDVNIADQLKQAGIFFAEDGFAAILEQVPAALVASVEGGGITGQQPAHQVGQPGGTRFQQQVTITKSLRQSGNGVAT